MSASTATNTKSQIIYTTGTGTNTTAGYTYFPYTGTITYPTVNLERPKQRIRAEDIDIEIQLKDGFNTSIPFKDYMKFVIVHHKLPDDCKDMTELAELLKESKMIAEL